LNSSKTKTIAGTILNTIENKENIVVLTGAGISTESGIPDFRSPGGIWSRFNPAVFSSNILYKDPERFYKSSLKLLEFLHSIKNAKPNKAHLILAKMESQGYISSIITQNIDGLHHKAGSKKVYEVHGNLEEGYCIDCGSKVTFNLLIEKILNNELPPRCGRCNGVLRPNIVFFEDLLPDSFLNATEEVKNSGLLIIVGSSLEVSPVNSLPYESKKFIIINKKRTYFDNAAYICWHEKASLALENIYRELKIN
jgi:NAD-dependent deacetylase